jgi:hypothetical protein
MKFWSSSDKVCKAACAGGEKHNPDYECVSSCPGGFETEDGMCLGSSGSDLCTHGFRLKDTDGSCRRTCSNSAHYIDENWNCVATCDLTTMYEHTATVYNPDMTTVQVKVCVTKCPSFYTLDNKCVDRCGGADFSESEDIADIHSAYRAKDGYLCYPKCWPFTTDFDEPAHPTTGYIFRPLLENIPL